MQQAGVVQMGEWRRAITGTQSFPRVSTSVGVRISTIDPEIDPNTGKLFFRSAEETTANLSHGGAFVSSMEPLEAGRRVLVELDLPRSGRLELVARVAWTQRQLRAKRPSDVDAPGFGVQFTEPSRAELARIDHYLESLEKQAPASRSAESTAHAPRP
jgi:Tfp pilus assembly protein PilZ